MGLPAKKRMSVEEFLAWNPPDDGLRYELVDGFPVGQAWPSQAHGRITNNLGTTIATRLRAGKKPCAVESGSILRVDQTNSVRAPDLLVRCGQTSRDADMPVLAIEVLSPSNTTREMTRKRDDFAAMGIREMVEVEQDAAEVRVYRLEGAFWFVQTVRGLDAEMRLHSLGLTIPLSEIYEDVTVQDEA